MCCGFVKKHEIGWGKVKLTPEGKQSCLKHIEDVHVLHWHGDTFDLPRECILLASNEVTKNQAFAYGKKIIGVQFHFEVLPNFIDFWTIGHFVELKQRKIDVRNLRKEFIIYAPQLKLVANYIIRDFIDS